MTITSTTDVQQQAALRLLARGFAAEFAEYVYSDDRYAELLMDCSMDFISENIPVTEDYVTDMAMLLIDSCSLQADHRGT